MKVQISLSKENPSKTEDPEATEKKLLALMVKELEIRRKLLDPKAFRRVPAKKK